MAAKSTSDTTPDEAKLIKYILDCKKESEASKHDRMELNKNNYSMFQLKHDFSHKKEGQSTEIFAKQRMAVVQITSFFQQAIADIGEWFNIDVKAHDIPEDGLPIKPHEAKKLLTYMQKQANYFSHIGNSMQSGLLGALIITKTDGKLEVKPKFSVRKEGKGKSFRKHVMKSEDKSWSMCSQVIRQEDYYPDPTGQKLYEIETYTADLHTIKMLSEGENAIYDKATVNMLSTGVHEDPERQLDLYRETGQNTQYSAGHRPKVRITEFWGTVIDDNGNITHENIVMTMANDQYLIRKPTPNPNWHQQSPYTVAPLIEVANSVWPIALMDVPTMHNRTIIELHNLILDAAFKQVHAPSQIRVQDLVDSSQVSDGVPAGTKLLVKSSLPPGAKVMEPLEEVRIPGDALNVLNILQQEFNATALTNDLRQGVMPFRAVKATEVVEASQTITSVFQGLAKNIETKFIEPELEKQWMTIAQNWDLISKDIFVALFGMKRGSDLYAMDPQDIFVTTINGYKFQVYGISQRLAKAQDFQKLTTLLQTIGSSDVFMEEFSRKYDFGKFLGEIMAALEIDKEKIATDQQEVPPMEAGPTEPEVPMGPNQDMSQVPSASNTGLAELFGNQGIPRTDFGGGQ